MRITNIDLQCEDIMWFAVDKNGYVVEFTSGGIGNVPEFVCADREENDFLEDYFKNRLAETTAEKLIVSYEDNDLINDAVVLSRKGIFCFDASGDSYDKLSMPEAPLNVENLPSDIRKILLNRILDVDVAVADTVEVDHAY
ncbi:MAG: hypothetical protein J6Q85_07975 [Clostridia bacterium]|nr:hypothetical protein [Clostridia bacterium]